MAFEFKLPELGEGVAEGEIVKWLVKEGDTVREDQPVVEVMTDKATVEIPSPKTGKILKTHGAEGSMAHVGSVIVTMELTASTSSKAEPSIPARSMAPAPQTTVALSSSQSPAQTSSTGTATRVLASPATRKLAREMGVDLSRISGSGPNGRVTHEDLAGPTSGAVKAGPPSAAAFQPRETRATGGEERIPLRGIRKKVAEHMVKARHTAAHFTQVDEVDFTQLVDLRARSKPLMESRGVKLTYLPFVIRSVCSTLREFPIFNASVDDAKGEIVIKHYFNIGIAVDTPDGLVVPVIKNADQKNILELAQEIQHLAEKARNGKLAVTDMQGGTFTITSTGNSGGLLATPIINHPEVAILGVQRIQETPVVRNGQVVIRQMGHVSLSLDHRIIDGARGALFLRRLILLLENPALLLVEA